MNLSYGYSTFSGQKIQRGKGGLLLGSKGLRTYEKKGGRRRGGKTVRHELAHQKIVGGRCQRGTRHSASLVYIMASVTESL